MIIITGSTKAGVRLLAKDLAAEILKGWTIVEQAEAPKEPKELKQNLIVIRQNASEETPRLGREPAPVYSESITDILHGQATHPLGREADTSLNPTLRPEDYVEYALNTFPANQVAVLHLEVSSATLAQRTRDLLAGNQASIKTNWTYILTRALRLRQMHPQRFFMLDANGTPERTLEQAENIVRTLLADSKAA